MAFVGYLWGKSASNKLTSTYKEAKKNLNFNKKAVNVAVCGSANSGKTRLIRAIGGTEEQKISWKSHSLNSKLSVIRYYSKEYACFLWEIPGIGRDVTSEKYYQDYCLAIFDCVLLITGESLRIDEIQIGVELISNNQNTPIAFIRSRCDRDLDQIYDDADDTDTLTHEAVRQEFLGNGHRTYATELKKASERFNSRNIFFISSTYIEKCEEELKLNEDVFIEFLKDDTTCIAFCGRSMTGKTALLEALLEFLSGREKFSSSAHASSKLQRYRVSLNSSSVDLFDISGATDLPQYFWDRKLIAFDCLLLFVDETVNESDARIAQLARRLAIPLVFVRSKCDLLLEKETRTKADSEKAIREALRRQLMQLDCQCNEEPYLVSAEVLKYLSCGSGSKHDQYKAFELDEERLCNYILRKFYDDATNFIAERKQNKIGEGYVIVDIVQTASGVQIVDHEQEVHVMDFMGV